MSHSAIHFGITRKDAALWQMFITSVLLWLFELQLYRRDLCFAFGVPKRISTNFDVSRRMKYSPVVGSIGLLLSLCSIFDSMVSTIFIVETIDWRLSSRESFKSDQLRLIRIGEGPGSWRERNDPENRASSLARLSPRLPRQRKFMRHLFVVDSLDKQIQNEKELIICVKSINLTWLLTWSCLTRPCQSHFFWNTGGQSGQCPTRSHNIEQNCLVPRVWPLWERERIKYGTQSSTARFYVWP